MALLPAVVNTAQATASDTCNEGKSTSGQVIWVCAPAPDRGLHLCCVVENDIRGGMPDIVFPSDVLTPNSAR